jgi:hypothetical protein
VRKVVEVMMMYFSVREECVKESGFNVLQDLFIRNEKVSGRWKEKWREAS